MSEDSVSQKTRNRKWQPQILLGVFDAQAIVILRTYSVREA